MRALVIEHEPDIPGGHLTDWLDARGIERDILRIQDDDREIDPAAYDFVVSLGSWHGAYEDIGWIHREQALLKDTHQRQVPILGICFGSQLLAKSLGGQAFRRPDSEVGWLKVRTRDDTLVPEGPWLVWHFDSFTLPPGAELVADTPDSPQAYVVGRSVGIQFHAEVTSQTVAAWVSANSDELEQRGVDVRRLLDEAPARAREARPLALRLFDAFVALTVGDGEARSRMLGR